MKVKAHFLKTMVICFCPLMLYAQSANDPEIITFSGYGPVAFDSFWRIPDDFLHESFQVRLTGRYSSGPSTNKYFTQYFESSIPLTGHNVLFLRMPVHYFSVNPEISENIAMKDESGLEAGDIDIVFKISFLDRYSQKKFNEKISFYLTGEMHTAPTSDANRQFTDAIKLLGTFNTIFSLGNEKMRSTKVVVSVGGGGWSDRIRPFQKHAMKISSMINHLMVITEDYSIGAFLGQTYLKTERTVEDGFLWKTGLYYRKPTGFQIAMNYGNLGYSGVYGHSIWQIEAGIDVPF